jgi:hypothetical protein
VTIIEPENNRVLRNICGYKYLIWAAGLRVDSPWMSPRPPWQGERVENPWPVRTSHPTGFPHSSTA